jgi:hypothetical protein
MTKIVQMILGLPAAAIGCLARLVRCENRWETQKWKDADGFLYETRRHLETGEIQVKHLNFFHGDGGRRWHPFKTARLSEQIEIQKFYQSNVKVWRGVSRCHHCLVQPF